MKLDRDYIRELIDLKFENNKFDLDWSAPELMHEMSNAVVNGSFRPTSTDDPLAEYIAQNILPTSADHTIFRDNSTKRIGISYSIKDESEFNHAIAECIGSSLVDSDVRATIESNMSRIFNL